MSWRTVGTIDTFIISFFVTGKASLAGGIAAIDTFIISFFVTGKASLAGGIAAIEVVTKIMIYYLHERVWAVVPWGTAKRPDLAGSQRQRRPQSGRIT